MRNSQPGEAERIVLDIVRKIDRTNRWYAKIPIVLAVEAYPKQSGSQFEWAFVNQTNRVLTMSEFTDKGVPQPGVPKTERITDQQVLLMQSLLSTESIRFDAEFFTTRSDPIEIKEKLKDLFGVHQYHQPETGKPYHTAKVGNRQDDVMVALLMLPYWSTKFKTSSKAYYLDWIRQRTAERIGGYF